MKYMGSKARLMKDIKPLIESFITKDTVAYVEPFAGGMNSICEIDFHNKIANDNNKYLIAMWRSLMDGKRFDHSCTREKYNQIKQFYQGKIDEPIYSDDEIGWFGFVASFNGKFMDSWSGCRKKGRDYIDESSRNIEKQISNMKNISFHSHDYSQLSIPNGSLIYCDIPYKDTARYKTGNFDHESFYDWCEHQNSLGNTVLISEFYMPEDRFECVWQKDIKTQIGLQNKHQKTEKLFKVK